MCIQVLTTKLRSNVKRTEEEQEDRFKPSPHFYLLCMILDMCKLTSRNNSNVSLTGCGIHKMIQS